MEIDKEEHLKLLKKIEKDPNTSQRDLSIDLNMGLGKINYCIKALKKKGLIKIGNFKKNKNKFKYIYVLTPRGIVEKAKITLKFMKIKMKEYDELKKELMEYRSKKK